MLVLNKISKTFGRKVVAEQVDLSVGAGRILAILGPSGCGKSTLLNMMAGLVLPNQGEVWLDERNITRLPPEQRHIAFMFQDYALLPHLNVWQNVAFGLRMRGVAKTAAREQAEAMLHEVGLTGESERKIERLSGGEQQRVALARALVVQPRLLLLDEPFSSLDTGLRHALRDLTARQIRQQAIPAVLVTHDPAEALLMADEIALMQAGRVIQQGKPNDLLLRPLSAWAANLMGCINVRDNVYIPPTAICLDAPQGVGCVVQQQYSLPDGQRIILQHPQWGELSVSVPQAQLHQWAAGQSIKVAVDAAQIISFKGEN